MFREYRYLFIITAIAVFFRFYQFPSNPPGLNWDEVAIGYNAYSILQTGKDEFGVRFPLTFRSFDDYKMPVYVYLTAGTISLFGYHDSAVRFPAAFSGVLTVIILYFFTFTLTRKKDISLLSALILAVLPWHVQFSRYASEAAVALFFTIAGVLCFVYAMKKRPVWLYGSVVLFSLALYTYLSFRVLIPILIVALLVLYRKQLFAKSLRLHTGIAAGLFILVLVPVVMQLLATGGNIRFSGVSVLNQDEAMQEAYARVAHEGELGINIPRRIFQRPPLYTNALLIARGYLTHLEPDFLFFDRGKLHFTPAVGLVYLWLLPFIVVGSYAVIKNGSRDAKTIVLLLLLIAPIPASVTFDIPHAIRSILLMIPLTVFAAFGIQYGYRKIANHHAQKLYTCAVVVAFIISSWNFLRQYHIHLPHERSQEWLYGRREMTDYLESVKSDYEYIVVSPRVEWPYIFMLYYSKYDPAQYLAEGGTVSGSWKSEENAYSIYEFRSVQSRDVNESVLVVGIPDDFSETVRPFRTIQYRDGTDALYFVQGSDL